MTTVTVTISVHREFAVSGGPDDNLDEHTDRVMEELLAIEDDQLTDSAVGVDLGTGHVEIEVTARARTFEDALTVADGAMRTAIHAAGGATPNWQVIQIALRAELVEA